MIRRSLRLQLTAVAFVAVVAASLAALRGQVAAQSVAIDNDDIGGVVTGPSGPEAGVWVIAETTDAAHPLHQERRDRRSGPLSCARPAERRPTTCGSAAMGLSIQRKSRRRRARLST